MVDDRGQWLMMIMMMILWSCTDDGEYWLVDNNWLMAVTDGKQPTIVLSSHR